jgi:3-mercaptopyruvate sulfurtransferase SseA
MLDSSRRLRVDDRRPFPLGEQTGSDPVPTAADLQHSAELDDMLAVPRREPVERLASALQHESSQIVYCGTAQEVSEGFAIALRAMGVETNLLPWGIAPDTTIPNREDN